MLGVQLPPGPLRDALADQLAGVLAAPLTALPARAGWACVPTGGCRLGEPCSPGSSPGRSTGGAGERPRGVTAARDRAKVEGEVRLLTGMLWPNPKRRRDPAVNRQSAG